MDKAENYSDFTEKLCDRVISESSSPVMEYLAFLFAYKIENYNLIDRLEVAGKVSDLARPLLLFTKIDRGASIKWGEMKESLMSALSAAPNDWIASHLYLTWRLITVGFFTEADTEVRSLDVISAAVKENSEMQYFELYLLRIAAARFEKDNLRREEIAHLRQALAIARKFNDGVTVASILMKLAGLTKHTDLQKAIDMTVTAKILGEELGSESLIGLVQHQMGHIMGMRGEYDAAAEYQCEYKANQEALGRSAPMINAMISLYYNLSGNGEKALKFAGEVFTPEEAPHTLLPYARAQQAWALINLGRYTEAEKAIEILQKHVLKSGDSMQMIWYNIIEGLFDKAEERFENAVINFKKALDSNAENIILLFQNICLLNLTEMEIDTLTDTSLHENHDSSGPWMKKLEGHVQEYDIPGVAAQSMILKAKLRYRQGKYDDVRKILKDVRDVAKNPSMRYLNDIIITKFPDVIVT
ncbi:MAG: hypothetical protein ACFFF9_11525 [Candidatus Thorarchaeota archaeon]